MKDKELDESLIALGFSRELVNYFPDYATLKNAYAVRELKDRYELIKHPVADKIVKLLEATIVFHSATDPDFRTMRESSLSDADLSAKLDNMAAAIMDYTTKINSLQLNSQENSIANAARDYCQQSIAEKIEALKQASDRMYVLYAQDDSALKQIIKRP